MNPIYRLDGFVLWQNGEITIQGEVIGKYVIEEGKTIVGTAYFRDRRLGVYAARSGGFAAVIAEYLRIT